MYKLIDAYKYIDENMAKEALEFGMKLSLNYERQVFVNGEKRMFIRSLLNPKDDIGKNTSTLYKCLKFEVESNHCFIADGGLYEFAQDKPELMDDYEKSVVSVKDYIFGSYRYPECLIGTTVLPSNISIENGPLGAPVLIQNSSDMYLENIIEQYKEKYDDINDSLLYSLYEKLVENGIFFKVAQIDSGNILYRDNNERLYNIKCTNYMSFNKNQEST